ncbi:class I SAM-dependent methyltransferase [Candidatus Villigracilis affinis]|uniref:class I SAM-dependent methyltransferase n=1 Tax=Candidatus Villigracilis affinis TaxID=3140682 RepID=UPI002A1DA6A9|nr:class I SAM-dependent methyltransferase [Anaerolineales bacterium]
METIRGKVSLDLDLTELQVRLANYDRIVLDLGTGDGKFAFCHADNFPNHFVIGVDSCRENLHEHSRAKLPNLLYIIASAQSLPQELRGLVSHITINFPWGSLLESLLNGDDRLLRGLESVAGSSAALDVRLNGGALAEQGWSLEDGAERIFENLTFAGWNLRKPEILDSRALRAFPSTWGKRLAFGRDPRAIQLSACL